MSEIDPATIEALKAKHGELFLLRASEETLLLRRPKRLDYDKFRKYVSDDRKRADAAETLAASCVVHPDRVGWSALLDTKPGLADVVAAKLVEIAGVDEAADLEKL